MCFRRNNANIGLRGFTLLELLVTLAILGISMSFAFPGLQNLQSVVALRSDAHRLISSFKSARSHAILGRTPVVVCPAASADVAAAVASQITSACGGDYQNGWLVFEDRDGNREFSVSADKLLRAETAVNALVAIRDHHGAALATATVQYHRSGAAVPGRTFFVCTSAAQAKKRWRVVVSSAGRVRSSQEAQGCSG